MRSSGRGFMPGAGGFRAWLIVFSCPPPPSRTFPATCGAWRNFGNATWVGHGSRGRSAAATCLSRARARLTKCSFQSPPGQELDNLSIHIAVEPFLAALEARYPGKADRVEVVDFFGRDEILWPICLTCAELLAARVPGKSPRVAALTQLFAAHLVEKYTEAAAQDASRIAAGFPFANSARSRITSPRTSQRKSRLSDSLNWWN